MFTDRQRSLLCELLREHQPRSMWGFAVNLPIELVDELTELEGKHGEESCNRALVELMVSTGLYRSEDGENVELI